GASRGSGEPGDVFARLDHAGHESPRRLDERRVLSVLQLPHVPEHLGPVPRDDRDVGQLGSANGERLAHAPQRRRFGFVLRAVAFARAFFFFAGAFFFFAGGLTAWAARACPANARPCGSRPPAMRSPPGTSIGPITILPPARAAVSAARSALGTSTSHSQ